MNAYDLPTTVSLDGREYAIRNNGDWRMVIDVNIALSDYDLEEKERVLAALAIFYPELAEIKDVNGAIKAMFDFIGAGEQENPKKSDTKLIDWEDDAAIIVSGVNHVLGKEVRAERYMHWWTFVAAYMAIGDSVLATVVSIRNKIHKGKKLEKHEQEFRRDNPQYFMPNKKKAQADYNDLLDLIGL